MTGRVEIEILLLCSIIGTTAGFFSMTKHPADLTLCVATTISLLGMVYCAYRLVFDKP